MQGMKEKLPSAMPIVSLIASLVAIVISGASFWLSFKAYQDQTVTNFAIDALPAYFEPVKLSYFHEGLLPDAIRLDAIPSQVDEQGKSVVSPRSSPIPNLASAFLELPVTITDLPPIPCTPD